MTWLTSLLIGILVVCAISIIVLVLLQHGKGADMGAAFGSGASGSLFGATGSANFLSRTTGVMAGLFFVTTVALAWSANHLRGQRPAESGGGGGVMSTMPAAPAGSAAPAADAKGAAKPAEGGAATAPAASEPAKPAPSDIPK